MMCQKHPLKFAERPDLQGSEAHEAASLKCIVSEVSDGPTEADLIVKPAGQKSNPRPKARLDPTRVVKENWHGTGAGKRQGWV